MTFHSDTVAWTLLCREIRVGEFQDHYRWVNHDFDLVFLGWRDDFVLVSRCIRDADMPMSEKRRYVFGPMSEFAPKIPENGEVAWT